MVAMVRFVHLRFGAQRRLRVRTHGPEFQALELAPVATDTIVPERHRVRDSRRMAMASSAIMGNVTNSPSAEATMSRALDLNLSAPSRNPRELDERTLPLHTITGSCPSSTSLGIATSNSQRCSYASSVAPCMAPAPIGPATRLVSARCASSSAASRLTPESRSSDSTSTSSAATTSNRPAAAAGCSSARGMSYGTPTMMSRRHSISGTSSNSEPLLRIPVKAATRSGSMRPSIPRQSGQPHGAQWSRCDARCAIG